MLRNNWKRRKRRLSKNKGHIPMASASYLSPSLPSLESKARVFVMGSFSESSKTSSNLSSKDKFVSSPRVTKLGIKDGVTTKEKPSFMA